MIRSTSLRTSLFSALLALVATVSTGSALAREGASGKGHGLKCYTAAVQQADGTVRYQQVCYKGV